MTVLEVPTYGRFGGVPFKTLVDLVLGSDFIPAEPPDTLSVDRVSVAPTAAWTAQARRAEHAVRCRWAQKNIVLSFSDDDRMTQSVGWFGTRPELGIHVRPLADVIASLRRFPDSWGCAFDIEGYATIKAPKPVGWGLFLKGEERERGILSRRYLERGPWLLREYGDLAVVYFHELDVDVETKGEQSREGHELMFGFSGGLVDEHVYVALPEGTTYVPETRRLDVAVYGRNVPLLEMARVREVQMRQALGPDKPIERVTYTFADPREAEAHLYDLWLRGLEVVTFIDGYQTVLTDGYEPPPHEPPEWTHRLAARLAEEGL